MLISDFGVEFPDFPGCVTAGTTLEEARRLAAEALALHVAGMQKDGEPLPPPSSLDAAMSDPDARDTGAYWSMSIRVRRGRCT
jgi:predicted RNase H-like HicB family nuclease